MASEGLKFGLGAFETIKVIDKKPIYYKDHLDRLIGSLDFLGLDTKDIDKKIEREVSKIDIADDNVLRIMAYQANDGIKIELESRKSFYDNAKYEEGLKLKLVKAIRDKYNPLNNHKTNNYLLNKICLRELKKEGYDEGIFLNQDSNFTEGTFTNIFFIMDNLLISPRVSDGILPGIYRKKLIERVKKEGIGFQERSIHISELADMDSMLVTNSLMQARFVKNLSGKSFVKNDLCKKILSFNR